MHVFQALETMCHGHHDVYPLALCRKWWFHAIFLFVCVRIGHRNMKSPQGGRVLTRVRSMVLKWKICTISPKSSCGIVLFLKRVHFQSCVLDVPSGGARGGPAGALAPPNLCYIKLICTQNQGLKAICRRNCYGWPPLIDDYHVWPPLNIISASAPGCPYLHHPYITILRPHEREEGFPTLPCVILGETMSWASQRTSTH
jgi:hypothetical protein